MSDAPARIYLQHDPDNCGGSFSEAHDVTWCQDRINTTDLEYRLAITWTRERPTVPGWYWWRLNKTQVAEMACIQRRGRGFIEIHGDNEFGLPDDGEWAGPIEAPK